MGMYILFMPAIELSWLRRGFVLEQTVLLFLSNGLTLKVRSPTSPLRRRWW